MKGQQLPSIVRVACHLYGAWIVGGAATEEHPKDVDVLVPYAYWSEVAALIPRDAAPNTFGGWRFVADGVQVDIWPGDLGELAASAAFAAAKSPRTGVLIVRVTENP